MSKHAAAFVALLVMFPSVSHAKPSPAFPGAEGARVLVHRVLITRLGGIWQTRNHPDEPPKVAGPLLPASAGL